MLDGTISWLILVKFWGKKFWTKIPPNIMKREEIMFSGNSKEFFLSLRLVKAKYEIFPVIKQFLYL